MLFSFNREWRKTTWSLRVRITFPAVVFLVSMLILFSSWRCVLQHLQHIESISLVLGCYVSYLVNFVITSYYYIVRKSSQSQHFEGIAPIGCSADEVRPGLLVWCLCWRWAHQNCLCCVVGETGIVPKVCWKKFDDAYRHFSRDHQYDSWTDRLKAEQLYDAWYDTVFSVVHGKKIQLIDWTAAGESGRDC